MVNMVQIYRYNGEQQEVAEIDARQAVRNHKDEWAMTPWTEEGKKRALAKFSPDKVKSDEGDKASKDAADAIKKAEAAAMAAHDKADKLKKAYAKASDEDKEDAQKALDAAESAADDADEAVRKLKS